MILFGTRGGRAITGSALKLGSLAALGGLAYKTFQDWQTKQGGDSVAAGVPIGELVGSAADARSRQLLLTMVTAANLDRLISDSERKSIGERLQQIAPGTDVETFISTALAVPLTIADLVKPVDSRTYAAEVYLAAASVLNQSVAAHTQWLAELADALKLDTQLAADLLQGLR